MRQFTILLFICLSIACLTTKKINTKSNFLNGTWIPLTQEFGGTSLPKGAFANQKLIISDSAYTVIAESVDKGVVKYQSDKMDIYGKEGVNAGKHFTAIYKFENDQLTVCYNLSGNNYPETYDTKGKPMYFLSVFKKE
jgi:uncharacterized protein (TIGR03067 family)